MDKWLFFGMLEIDAPYDRHCDECIVSGDRSLHIDIVDMFVAISFYRMQSLSDRITFILTKFSMVAIFSFYGNCLHKCLKERD